MRAKLMKVTAIGLFTIAMLLNLSVYFDSNDYQNADISLGSIKISLFQKAFATEPTGTCSMTVNCFNAQCKCSISNCLTDCSCTINSDGQGCKCTCGTRTSKCSCGN
ncbi:MAG: hypothetical protein JXQ65_05915 [Candidatus Marinimicrobia bacterium]|nr:hypothetical protein [Candidatus Neomarinimicrobiota bacterium]